MYVTITSQGFSPVFGLPSLVYKLMPRFPIKEIRVVQLDNVYLGAYNLEIIYFFGFGETGYLPSPLLDLWHHHQKWYAIF